MPKGSEQLTNSRREEIIDACAALYEKMNFKDITIKEISKYTSFTRTSIYNYFRTKEEIFLALFQREYELWIDDLTHLADDNQRLSADDFASKLASSLEKRQRLLKLLSMNMYDMEENSSMDSLVAFKRAYGRSINALKICLKKFFPQMTERDAEDFIFTFFPFIYGIYPYTYVTEKQREAMEKAGVEFKYLSVYEMAYMEIKKLLDI